MQALRPETPPHIRLTNPRPMARRCRQEGHETPAGGSHPAPTHSSTPYRQATRVRARRQPLFKGICLRCCLAIAILLCGGFIPTIRAQTSSQNSSQFTHEDFGNTTRGGRLLLRLPEQGDVQLYKDSYALIIGNSQYRNGWKSLPGASEDIVAVRDILREHGFRVGVVENTSRVQLERVFTEFINRYGANPENRLLFYYAGHGHSMAASYGGDKVGYLIPIDAPIPGNDASQFLRYAFPLSQIDVYAKQIQSKHVLFVFDACFAGSIFSDLRSQPPASIQYQATRPVRQFITSGEADEAVPDKSIFRRQFVAGLKGEADLLKDGYVSGEELSKYLQSTVVNYSNKSQHPQYGKLRHPELDKGDFIFELPQRRQAETRTESQGMLFLNALPPATVKVNGRSISMSPIEELMIKSGQYSIQFSSRNGNTLKKVVTVGPDEVVRCTAFFNEMEIRCRTNTRN